MAELEHIGSIITETLSALQDAELWEHDSECTKEQIEEIMTEVKTDILNAIKYGEDLQKGE